MSYEDDLKAAKRKQRAVRQKLDAKYGKIALKRLKKLGNVFKTDLIDMSDEDFDGFCHDATVTQLSEAMAREEAES